MLTESRNIMKIVDTKLKYIQIVRCVLLSISVISKFLKMSQ